MSLNPESRPANSPSLQKCYQPKGVKNPGPEDQVFDDRINTSRMAANAKDIKNDAGIADEMIEHIR